MKNRVAYLLIIICPFYTVAQTLGKQDMFLQPFAPSEVVLTNSWIKERQVSNMSYINRLDKDRLLHNFRVNAGIYSSSTPLEGWEHPNIGLRGHFTGHYLSALSYLVAQTNDKTLKMRLDSMVIVLNECQQRLGGQYLSAFPVSEFDTLEKTYTGVWAPYYTYHKIMQGLLDAYVYGKNHTALDVVKRMADFVKQRMDRLSHEQIEKILYTRSANPTNEAGGMNEVMYHVYRETKDPNHLKLAQLFDRDWFLDPLIRNINRLSGLHSNTHIALVNGFAARYELTRDKEYRLAVENFYQMVEKHHSYANGTSSGPRPIPATRTAIVGEHWGDSDRLSTTLTPEIGESCVTHNMQKITSNLFRWSKNPAYADDYLNRYYNAVLSAKHSQTSQVLYHLPLSSPSQKRFLKEDDFRCCNGSSIEAFNQLTSGIYYHNESELWITNYVPSILNWKQQGFVLEQQGDMTKDEELCFRITAAPSRTIALHFLIPHWAAKGTTLSVNGELLKNSSSGVFVTINRQWKAGDEIRISLKNTFRLVQMVDNSTIIAIYYGASLLAFETSQEVILKGTHHDILKSLVKDNERADSFTLLNGEQTYRLRPLFNIDEQSYGCYVMIRNY